MPEGRHHPREAAFVMPGHTRSNTMPRGPGRDGRPWRRLKERLRRTCNVCGICGQPIDHTLRWPHPGSFSVDHIIPYSIAPELALEPTNVRGSHLGCNSSRGTGQTPTLDTSENW